MEELVEQKIKQFDEEIGNVHYDFGYMRDNVVNPKLDEGNWILDLLKDKQWCGKKPGQHDHHGVPVTYVAQQVWNFIKEEVPVASHIILWCAGDEPKAVHYIGEMIRNNADNPTNEECNRYFIDDKDHIILHNEKLPVAAVNFVPDGMRKKTVNKGSNPAGNYIVTTRGKEVARVKFDGTDGWEVFAGSSSYLEDWDIKNCTRWEPAVDFVELIRSKGDAPSKFTKNFSFHGSPCELLWCICHTNNSFELTRRLKNVETNEFWKN